MSLIDTQQALRHQVVHREAADAATEHMTKDADLKIVRKTEYSTYMKQHAVGSEYLYTAVNGKQFTVKQMASVRREPCNQVIAARNGLHLWSRMAFVQTVCKIELHDVVSSGIFADEFPRKHSQEWTIKALVTLPQATEA
jgi:hypothetical protein